MAHINEFAVILENSDLKQTNHKYMTQEQKKFEEVTLYNFTSLRSPQNREKDDEDMKIDFIYCDLLFNKKDKSIIIEEVSKINGSKEINSFDDLYDYEDHFRKIIDFGKTLNEYRYKEINFYKIHKELLKIEYSDENIVNSIKRITWKTLVRITKSGGELKLKEALINILRTYHIKKNVKLISDPEYKEDIPFFKRLIDAQVVIPKELFPKEETFFFGEKYNQYQIDKSIVNRVVLNQEISKYSYYLQKLNMSVEFKGQIKTNLDKKIGAKDAIDSKIPTTDIFKTAFYGCLFLNSEIGNFILNYDEFYFKNTKEIKTATITINDNKIEYHKSKTESLPELLFELNIDLVSQIISSEKNEIQIFLTIILEDDTNYDFDLILIKQRQIDDRINFIEYLGNKEIILNDGNDYYGQAFAPSGYGVKQLGIIEYRKVTSTISRYVPAEVAKIENVMASEYRELATVKELTKEVTDFESSETSNEKENETVSTDRFQMQNEISKIFDQQNKNSFDTKASYNGGTTSLDISYGTSTINSKNESNKQAVTNSKEITNKAVEKIFTKVRKERTVKVTEKFTESSKHGFDNRGNPNHVSGVYRHINAVYKNQIYNYGRRLLYEFAIPEPALFHRLAILEDNNLADVISKIPKHPILDKLPKDYTEITRDNYLFLEKLTDVTLIKLPEEVKIVVNQKYFDNGGRNPSSYDLFEIPDATNSFRKIQFPEGYLAESFQLKVLNCDENGNGLEYDTNAPKNKGFVDFTIGGTKYRVHTYDGDSNHDRPFIDIINKPIENYNLNPKTLDWYLTVNDVHRIAFSITINIKMSNNFYINWQKSNYDIILKKYVEENSKYLTQIKKNIEENPIVDNYKETDKDYIQNICLRKQCISYLISEDPKNNHRLLGQDMFEKRQFMKTLKVNMSSKLNEYTAFARFLEQAFDWNMMSYSYYPFYWADKDEWRLMYNLYDGDADFKKFLQAGMARVVVSVKPGFEKAIMQYMITGKIWEGGEIPTYGSSMFLSIAAEMKESAEYKIEETWETVLPTNLIALQSSGVAINQEGLPNLENSQDLGEMTDNPYKLPKRKKFLGLF